MDTEQSFEELVEWATTPAQSGLRLYNWGALVCYNLELLNKTWDQLGTTPSPPESIETIQSKHTLYENEYVYHLSVLERPTLKFNASSDSPHNATLRRRIQKFLDFRFLTVQGRPLLTSINACLSGTQHLNIEANGPKLSYSTQRNVEFRWDIADYTLTGSHDNSRRFVYEKYYEDNPAKRNAILGSFAPAQDGFIKPPIYFSTYADSRTGQVVACVALGEYGGTPSDLPLMLVNGKAATALVDRRKSLAGIPADLGQLPQLLAPHQQFSMTAANTDAPKDHVAIYDPVGFSGTINAAMPPKFDVSPLSSLLSPLQKIEIKVFPEPASVNWELQPGAQGRLFQEGDKWFYEAPESSEPGVPSWVDVISTNIEGLRYESVFVTVFVPRAAYFKFSKVDNCVHIQLCTDDGFEETIIPPERIEWKILHGNGSVDHQGTFTPSAYAASPFTIIQARIKDILIPIIACVMLPVPMLSVDDAVVMFNS
ncbi:hypothetical protein [Pseudomonas asiatica]|uniref:Uncharacterized protein n=1 Tax=Pseudomonas asiatica TaxID=2219225 RepID=A0ABU5L3A6_9PSED|nr:hypothetical protein [Pseudomonas asiatica]MDZ5740353.1 hypothetical protein [Pseudomonas asiatica]MDZ5744984.1 hypothetical protein [Pseudomonas asiatica]MDZ5750727.1 hypothetical protein [Pseudomonas asiatica]MDZ5755679.1 hypothetical protein [Pseudomonas asiatica]